MRPRHFIILSITIAGLSMLLSNRCFGKDYRDYHLSIAKIEQQLFVQGKIQEGLNGYKKLFQEYDFVFLQDCVTALQMALYAERDSDFLVFVDKGTKNGLMPRHLAKMSYVTKSAIYKKYVDTIDRIYHRNRPSYLERIDTTVLKSVNSIYAFDQIDKNELPRESRSQYQMRYKENLFNSISKLKAIIDQKGWIGDKLIGVDQNDIVKELRLDAIDLHRYFIKYKAEATSNAQSQFLLNEFGFSSTMLFPVILHNGMFEGIYSKRRSLIYSDSFFLHQIMLGNIHPKDVAFFYDQPYSVLEGSKPDTAKGERYFGLGIRMVDTQQDALRIPDVLINKFRKEFYIAPIEQDRAKQAFFRKNKMYLGWGYNGIRS